MIFYRVVSLAACLLSFNLSSMHHEMSKEDIARGWIEAGYTGKDEAIAYVKKFMSEFDLLKIILLTFLLKRAVFMF